MNRSFSLVEYCPIYEGGISPFHVNMVLVVSNRFLERIDSRSVGFDDVTPKPPISFGLLIAPDF